MSADTAIVLLKYMNKETNAVNYRATFVQAPENLFVSYWYIYEAFFDQPVFSVYSLVDSYITKLLEKVGGRTEYGIILLNLSSKTWDEIEEKASLELFKFSDYQPTLRHDTN